LERTSLRSASEAMLKQPLLKPYNLGQPAPRPLRINVLYCAIASCVVTTMGLCMAIVFWRTSSRMLTKSLTEAAAKLPEVRARWNEMERKSHKFLKATEKDIREFASATFGDGVERDDPVTNDGTEDSAPWGSGQQTRKGARRLLLT